MITWFSWQWKAGSVEEVIYRWTVLFIDAGQHSGVDPLLAPSLGADGCVADHQNRFEIEPHFGRLWWRPAGLVFHQTSQFWSATSAKRFTIDRTKLTIITFQFNVFYKYFFSVFNRSQQTLCFKIVEMWNGRDCVTLSGPFERSHQREN